MEKILLSKLDPKAKEHQRKKVLRIFFSWNCKLAKDDMNIYRFWDWVKCLSPDNLNSTERFKSMSYEFLDKLISKKTFRESFSFWINNVYLPSLTKSTEDEHTRHFLQFVINSIEIKQNLEQSKEKYLQDKPMLENLCKKIEKTVEIPNEPGLYAEFRCSRGNCSLYKMKNFGFVGANSQVNCSEIVSTSRCHICNNHLNIINFGVYGSKFFISGTVSSSIFEPLNDMSNYYITIDEYHFYDWEEMIVEVIDLNEEEKYFLENIVLSSFSDPTVPKKKYCKRKGNDGLSNVSGESDVAGNVLSLEKEIRDLDSQIYDLVADNYKNDLLIQELKAYLADPMLIER
ncbi:hypothetical protein SteCoe_23300 [Stentor coeruleus]|uniref:Uncharacterized protein n=1 Tax=Stentor coeruleus TaxID=5963 RepID=A0A1R2BK71_9CILI|nr:hypothetical protein SteCoe_23300 [Stentor coeruleus]